MGFSVNSQKDTDSTCELILINYSVGQSRSSSEAATQLQQVLESGVENPEVKAVVATGMADLQPNGNRPSQNLILAQMRLEAAVTEFRELTAPTGRSPLSFFGMTNTQSPTGTRGISIELITDECLDDLPENATVLEPIPPHPLNLQYLDINSELYWKRVRNNK
jgi:hypothetical protein